MSLRLGKDVWLLRGRLVLLGPVRRTLRTWLTVVCAVGITALSSAATANASQAFTFQIEPSWSASERTQLKAWLSATGPVMKTVLQVAGPPAQNLTVKVVKETTGNAGEYNAASHQITLASLSLSVLAHELMHATRDGYGLSNSAWEEGLARAGEKEVMRLLKLQGITEAGYDTNHEYGYDEYYEQNNVPAVGVPYGNIYTEPALVLLRYEQAGYAFAKILMEDPQFVAQFNAKVFTHPNGSFTPKELVSMAASVQPLVEQEPLAKWIVRQRIFSVSQRAGCYLFQRANQFTVDFYCTDQYGDVSAQSGTQVSFRITDASNKTIFKATDTTSNYGWVTFSPSLAGVTGRIKMVATATSASGPVRATVLRQAGNAEGVFGVVTGAATGTLRFDSPTAQFAPLTVGVIRGAFVAPALGSVRGQVVAEFSGEGKTARQTFDKDAAPYSVLMTAH